MLYLHISRSSPLFVWRWIRTSAHTRKNTLSPQKAHKKHIYRIHHNFFYWLSSFPPLSALVLTPAFTVQITTGSDKNVRPELLWHFWNGSRRTGGDKCSTFLFFEQLSHSVTIIAPSLSLSFPNSEGLSVQMAFVFLCTRNVSPNQALMNKLMNKTYVTTKQLAWLHWKRKPAAAGI